MPNALFYLTNNSNIPAGELSFRMMQVLSAAVWPNPSLSIQSNLCFKQVKQHLDFCYFFLTEYLTYLSLTAIFSDSLRHTLIERFRFS